MASRVGEKRKGPQMENSPEKETPSSHAKQNPRISKQDFFAIAALWMERCPLGNGAYCKEKAGAVFVGPNDRILAMDCSRNDVHAAARVLINFPDKVKGCTVYTSRKPCSYCVKLLVQAEVKKIMFLPFQPEASPDPECDELDNAIRIENLLKVFPVGMSMYKPEVSEGMQEGLASTVRRPDGQTFDWRPFRHHLRDTYWSDEWVERLENIAGQSEIPGGELEHGATRSKKPKQEEKISTDIIRWPGLDASFVVELQASIEKLIKWIALATVAPIPGGSEVHGESYEFKPFPKHKEETSSVGNKEGGDGCQEHEVQRNEQVPNPSSSRWQELALHMSRMALIAARRTDDPCTGVGVILLVKDEVVSVGLNGYPSKANVGDFPRSKDAKTHGTSLKYPYLIHAEQNALLLRNTRDIKDESTTAFVTKTPCDECVGLLVASGVRNVVLPWEEKKDKSKPGIKYEAFSKAIEDSNFRAFYGKVVRPHAEDAKRKIIFEKSEKPTAP